MFDIFVLFSFSLVVGLALACIVTFIWLVGRVLWTTGSARRPRSGATRMTDEEYAQRWEQWNWKQRAMNREQSSSH